ncbi:MAG: AAA family ATPase [Nannocystaceae bacterium]
MRARAGVRAPAEGDVSELFATYAPYLPPPLLRDLIADPERSLDPVERRFQAAALCVEVSWSSLLSGVIPRPERDEAREFAGKLDACLEQVIDAITSEGGEPIRLATGPVLALFPAGDRPDGGALAIRRALQAGERIRERLGADADGLCGRAGVGVGEVVSCEVGGIYDRWAYVVAGGAIDDAMRAARGAVDACGISPRARMMIHPARLEPAPFHPPAVPDDLELALEASARRFVPTAVCDFLQHGLREWLEVLQPLTALVLRVHGFSYEREGVAAELHALVREVQEAVVEREGVMGEVSFEGGGTVLWALFGVPPLTRQDDALRAVRCALAIQARLASDELQQTGLRGALGMATGLLYAGPAGSEARREYAAVGAVFQRARALMAEAGDGQLLCDGETYRQIRSRVACDVLPSMSASDGATTAVYRPYSEVPGRPRVRDAIIGRMAERVLIAERLGKLPRGDEGGVLVIEGEAGIGKSRLVRDLYRQAEVVGVRTLTGRTDALAAATAYHAWRPVFGELLGIDGLRAPSVRRARTLERLTEIAAALEQEADADADSPGVQELAPLLGDVLGLELPDNDLTAHMRGGVRAKSTRALLVRLLEFAVLRGYRVVVLEDAHWLDSLSWSLALAAARALRPLLLVIATRPFGEQVPGEFAQLLATPSAHHVKLGPLTADDVRLLVGRRFGADQLPEVVVRTLRESAGGHPLFGEELAYALRDAGAIEVSQDGCKAVEGGPRLGPLPDTVAGVIASRIEQLSPSHQLTLMVASVIGRTFEFEILREVHPVASDKPQLLGQLATLGALDITPLATPDPDRSYRFKHTITREVAYSVMPAGQRRQIHAAVAEWFESNHGQDLAQHYALLVHHWRRSGDVWRTIIYLESAGEQALERGAFHEGARFFSELLELAAGDRGDRRLEVEGDRRARWERSLGRAHLGLGDNVAGRRHLERSLATLGWPMPRGRGLRAIGLFRQVMIQVRGRVASRLERGRASASREELLEAARTHADLVAIYAIAGDLALLPYCVLMIVNLAEAAGGKSTELVEGYALMTTLVSSHGWHALADEYALKAEDGAREVGDLSSLGQVLVTLGVYQLGRGRWRECEARLEESVKVRERLGDPLLGESLLMLAGFHLLRGHYDIVHALARRLLALSGQIESHIYRAWATGLQVTARLEAGELDAARDGLERWARAIEGRGDRWSELALHAQTAAYQLQRGGPVVAREAHARAEAILEELQGASPIVLSSVTRVVEVAFALWEVEGTRQARRRAKRAVRALTQIADNLRIARPMAALWEGVYAWQGGREARAIAAWERALADATSLQMPLDEARIHVAIARFVGPERRTQHLERAIALLEALGHGDALARARAELHAAT